MSHSALRHETDCLNCGATVHGRYCHVCGQENVNPKESFWHMVTHFFYDITHFDGSFFVTLKDLLFKPGFLSREYMMGRRKKYLHPVRMYVFTSAVFFLVFFSMFQVSEKSLSSTGSSDRVNQELARISAEAYKDAKTKQDSLNIEQGLDLLGYKEDTIENKKDTIKTKGGVNFSIGQDTSYRTVKDYDSVQNSLPKEKREKGLTRIFSRKSVELNEKYKGDQQKIAVVLINKFLHTFPYLLFVSLPLYALFLKILYVRRRKEFYFADHGVFLIHLYIFTFLAMLCMFGLDKLSDKTNWEVFDIVLILLILAGIFYVVKAMRNFYRQGWGKTIIKFILFNILCLVSIIGLFTIFFAFSLYQI